ncbi:MAG: Gfo/Idh/MocA family protein [Planctomycetota bacterium]
MPAGRITRRRFLGRCAGAAAGVALVPSSVMGGPGRTSPSDRVVMGCIGVGSRGQLDTKGLMHQGAQIVAVCDVDRRARERTKKIVEDHYARKLGRDKYKGCATYNDFRELLARDDIDAVMIATPDHWHVPTAIEAVKRGKDVYVEKPLGMTIAEGQALREAVLRYGAVFMHGTEQRTMRQFRFACELVRNGYLGDLKLVKVAVPGGRATGIHRTAPVPDWLDYDMWLGPAPWNPYTPARCRVNSWYFISDYMTSGFVAGWGIHHVDIAQWALDADSSGPVEIEGTGVFPGDGLYDTAVTWDIDYTYAGGVRVNFTDNKKNKQGVEFIGTKGRLHVDRARIKLAEPKSLHKAIIGPNEIHLYESDNDDRNFLECVKTRAETASPIEVAHRSTTVCYLGNIAMLLGRKLKWDPVKERFVGDDEANRMLSGAMRSPWRL